jgi:hypothetical protein
MNAPSLIEIMFQLTARFSFSSMKTFNILPFFEDYSNISNLTHTTFSPFSSVLVGIKIVAYSPLGCGFLTGSIRGREADCFDENDFRLKGVDE